MASKQPAKSHQLTTRLEPKIHEVLTSVAQRIGVKPAVLAGMAIGDFITKLDAQYNATEAMQDKVAGEVAKVLEKQFALMFPPEAIKKMMEKDE